MRAVLFYIFCRLVLPVSHKGLNTGNRNCAKFALSDVPFYRGEFAPEKNFIAVHLGDNV